MIESGSDLLIDRSNRFDRIGSDRIATLVKRMLLVEIALDSLPLIW